METYANQEESGVNNRTVFAEITTKSTFLSPTDPRQNISRSDSVTNARHALLDNSLLRYTTPQELIIQQRGQRKIPITFSPDIDIVKQSMEISKSGDSNLNRSSISLKETSRKRLVFDDPLQLDSNLPNPKRMHIEQEIKISKNVCLISALRLLNQNQLINLIQQIVSDHSDIEKEIRTKLPITNLKDLEDHIIYLRRKIYKALPRYSRLISKSESVSFYAVSMHILEFKKYVVDQGKYMIECKQWQTVMEYVFMAWKHVRKIPTWNEPSHNVSRMQCFKSLMFNYKMALIYLVDTLSIDERTNYKNQLKVLADDNNKEEVEYCLQILDVQNDKI